MSGALYRFVSLMTRVKHELEEEEELKEVDAQGMPLFVSRQLSDEDQQARTHPPTTGSHRPCPTLQFRTICVRSCAYMYAG